MWVDGNSNGVTDAGELKTLESLGISKLDLAATSSTAQDHGNILGLLSSYETTDGQTHQMADVWFQTSNPATSGGTSPTEPTVLANTLGQYNADGKLMVVGATSGVSNNPTLNTQPDTGQLADGKLAVGK